MEYQIGPGASINFPGLWLHPFPSRWVMAQSCDCLVSWCRGVGSGDGCDLVPPPRVPARRLDSLGGPWFSPSVRLRRFLPPWLRSLPSMSWTVPPFHPGGSCGLLCVPGCQKFTVDSPPRIRAWSQMSPGSMGDSPSVRGVTNR